VEVGKLAFWDGIFRREQQCDDLLARYYTYDGERWPCTPLVASLMLTYNCNLSCLYCPFQRFFSEIPPSPLEEWEKLLERLASVGARRISFSGGEPLLYPSLEHLIEIATELGISKGVVTNGTLLSEKRLEAFAVAGLNALTVSLDTVDDRLYARLCSAPIGTLPKVLEMIIAAKRLGNFWTGINTVITNINVKMVGSVMEFCSKHSIPVQFQVFNPHEDVENLMPGGDELRDAIDLILAGKKAGVPVLNSEDYLDACCEFASTLRFPKAMECLIPFVEMVVTPDLKIKACCASEEVGCVSDPLWEEGWVSGGANRWRCMARDKACQNCFLIYHEPLRIGS
jgi:MoaA/NifB/PqqE/SkfB family radical SAM enzyme